MTRLRFRLRPTAGLDLGANHHAATEARAKGDVAGFLRAYGCPEPIAKRMAKRAEYKRMMNPKTREDFENVERAVRAAIEIEAEKR